MHIHNPDFSGACTLLDDMVASRKLPCASLLVRQGGRELLFHSTGSLDLETQTPVGRDTLFRLFSMTKPIVAAAIMILVDRDVLRLDDRVADHVPEFAALRVHGGGDDNGQATVAARSPITIEHLLTHTAGFSYWFYPDQPVSQLYAQDPRIGVSEDWCFDPALGGTRSVAQALSELPLVDHPGTRWHYSMSLEVAGILIERLTGRQLGDFLASNIFNPLGMVDTAFSVPPSKAARLASLYGPSPDGQLALRETGASSRLLGPVPGHAGGGGLVSTIDDYSRFAEMLRQRGRFNGGQILSEASAAAMMTSRLPAEMLDELGTLATWGLGGTGDGLGFGLGGAVAVRPPANGVPVFPGEYSWGGGASTTFWVDPVNDLTAVFMTQFQPPSAEMLRDRLHLAIYEAMGARPLQD